MAWDQSPIFKKLYEEEYGQFGGEPYGAFVADYYFDNSAPDVELLAAAPLLGTLRELTLDLCGARPIPPIATPRSLDLAHLHTALWFHGIEAIDRFVTLDGSQQQAARELAPDEWIDAETSDRGEDDEPPHLQER